MFNKEIMAVLIAYLLGSVPFAYIFARVTRGIDIRQAGTGNVGAMNTWREAGTLPGLSVLVLDAAKGSLAVLTAEALGMPLFVVMLSGIAAVAGHNWPVFLHFKGGRGAATTLGVLLAFMPEQFGISFVVIATILLLTWNTGLAVGVGVLVLILVAWATGREAVFVVYPFVLGVFGLLRNIFDLKQELEKYHSLKAVLFRSLPFPGTRGKSDLHP
ncbi:MAG: glycerol-3-phosphate acyltransferase [Dehalococcoidales bacterium]|nr:glycerol-3-phosphate acyltransferase [Dehalococcoidales bacterium]